MVTFDYSNKSVKVVRIVVLVRKNIRWLGCSLCLVDFLYVI